MRQPADSQRVALTIHDLSVSYGRIDALKHVNLEIREGEIVAILGANGAGKSSLLRAISGLVPVSGGEQQMLAIGRALMANPKILLLDEPSLGLAPLIVRDIFNIVEQLNKQGVTIVLVEQNAKQSLKIAHYAYVLEVGSVSMEGPAEELLKDDRVIEAYLGKS